MAEVVLDSGTVIMEGSRVFGEETIATGWTLNMRAGGGHFCTVETHYPTPNQPHTIYTDGKARDYVSLVQFLTEMGILIGEAST